jgi:hypothetical protein
MGTPTPDMAASERAALYAARRGLRIVDRLGSGMDGTVWSTDRATALKVHDRRHTYEQERAAYERLRDSGVEQIRGHAIPRLVELDHELLAIEMSVVQPPYLLDFASARLDEAVAFPDEVLDQWHAEKREQFEDRWPAVELVLWELRDRHGIYLLDIHPGNITFEEEG